MTPMAPALLQYRTEVEAQLQHQGSTSTGIDQDDYIWFMQQGYSPEEAAASIAFYNRPAGDGLVVMNQYAQARYDIEVDINAAKIMYQNRLDELSKQLVSLQQRCPHENQREDSEHYPGDYYDRASTTYITVCEDCGRELNGYTKQHNYYG